MIVFDDNDKVIANGAIYITDILRLCDYIKPFRRKLQIKLRKEEKITYEISYPFEVYYATRIFNTFIKTMLRDVMFHNVMYKHNNFKSIFLQKETNIKAIKFKQKKFKMLPTMPIYNVILRMQHKNNYLYKNLNLYKELLDEFKQQTFNGDLQEGVKEIKTSDDYLETLVLRFPNVQKNIIKKIIKDGIAGMFMPVKNYKTDVIVCDFHHAKDRVCAVLNSNSYSTMLPHYKALIRFSEKYKDDSFYAVFTDEEQEKIEAGEKDVSGLCIFTMAYVKLFVKGKKRARYKHIYKIARTNQNTYKYYIQRNNVKTNRIKYLYRRFNERYEPINNTK